MTEDREGSGQSGKQSSGHVAILLATYNGGKFLDEQMCSIFSQTYQDFGVIARDDGSSDCTLQVLRRWSAVHPGKIAIVSDELGNLRSLRSFSRLLELCDAPYFALCDQDDVWLPNKLDISINEIQQLESRLGKETPILVHSDLRVVDIDLQETAPSFFRYSHIKPGKAERLDHLIINNIVAGCASMGNRALLDRGWPIPDGVPHHDWWLALVATSCGVLRTIAEPTILWRQHGRNQVGAGRGQGSLLWDSRYILRQPRRLKVRMAKALRILQYQACLLLRIAGDKMPRRNRIFLQAFCLPRSRDEAALLPWAQRTWLFARFLMVYARMLPLALRWCR